ncbi:MAG: response regulator [Lachnospirales bacterium]
MKKILIADDDMLVHTKISKLILNYNIVHAYNGCEALDIIRKNDIFITLLDISMPKKTGIDICKYVKYENLKTKIIIISSYDTFEFARDSLKYGAHDYILKHELTKKKLNKLLNHLCAEERKEATINENHLYNILYNNSQPAKINCKYFQFFIFQIANFAILTYHKKNIARQNIRTSITSIYNNIFNNGTLVYKGEGLFCSVILSNNSSYSDTEQQNVKFHKLLEYNIKKILNIDIISKHSNLLFMIS